MIEIKHQLSQIREFVPAITCIGLVAFLAAASLSDMRIRRIPNWLIVAGILFSMMCHYLFSGTSGMLHSLAGIVVGFLLLMIPFIFGGLGAGDVKMMSAVGAFLGPIGVVVRCVLSFVFGGIYALILIFLHRGEYKITFKKLILSDPINYETITRQREADVHKAKTGFNTRPVLCFGVPIALGTLTCLLMGLLVTNYFT